MILLKQIQKPLKKVIALVLRYTVDVLHVGANGEHALPACHRVGADDRMDCFEYGTDVFWRASRLVVQLESRLLGDLSEIRLLKGHCQRLEKLLVSRAETVVDVISRCP